MKSATPPVYSQQELIEQIDIMDEDDQILESLAMQLLAEAFNAEKKETIQ